MSRLWESRTVLASRHNLRAKSLINRRPQFRSSCRCPTYFLHSIVQKLDGLGALIEREREFTSMLAVSLGEVQCLLAAR